VHFRIRIPATGRDALYYVRAIQEPSPAVKGGQPLQVRRAGHSFKSICARAIRRNQAQRRLLEAMRAAWSSPIFVETEATAALPGRVHEARAALMPIRTCSAGHVACSVAFILCIAERAAAGA